MIGLSIPHDYPLIELVGQEVTQLCIGLGQVQLHFYKPVPDSSPQQWTPGARVELEAGYELQVPGRETHLVRGDQLAQCAGELTVLIGQAISSVSKLAQNQLALVFAFGARLHLLTDEHGFESYHLHVAGQSVDVAKPA